MKLLLHAGALVVGALLTAPAAAQDQSADWSQFYLGVGLAAQLLIAEPVGEYELIAGGQTVTTPFTYGGFSAHALAGYSHQIDTLIVGAEAEVDFGPATILGEGAAWDQSDGPCFSGTAPCATAELHGTLDTLGRARAIVGIAANEQLMFFATAGVAVADYALYGVQLEAVASNNAHGIVPAALSPPETQRLIGGTIGAGVQAKMTDHVSVRAEVIGDFYTAPPVLLFPVSIVGDSSAMVNLTEGLLLRNATARASIIVGF